MKHETNNSFSIIKCIYCNLSLRILFIFLLNAMSFSASAEDRFAAPNLNTASNSFNNRFTASSFNVDFLISHVLNNSRQIERSGEELRKNTSFITEQTNTLDGAISNSVIVPAGTDADTIIILNINEGDSFAIQR